MTEIFKDVRKNEYLGAEGADKPLKSLIPLNHNVAVLTPGITFAEFNEKAWRIPDKYQARRF